MAITAKAVKDLRDKTGAGMMDCKKALNETDGDVEKAIDFLRKQGMADASKKSGRIASEGLVYSYIHGEGRIGVLIEVNCETDFVARTDKFVTFVNDLCLHIAATNPRYLSEDQVPAEDLVKEKAFLSEQALESGKPPQFVEKMVEGRMGKFYKENCLLDQPFVKNPDITVLDHVKLMIADVGENVNVRRYERYELGEGLEKRSNDLAAEVAEQMENAK
jgi:elongation factor Ts